MTPATKNMVGAALIGISGFAFWVYDVGGYDQIGLFNAAIEERQATLDERRSIIEHVRLLNSQYNKRKAEIARFSSTLPTKKSVAELISATSTIASESGVQMSGLNISPGTKTAESDKPIPITVTMRVGGAYEAIRTFLNNIEQNNRIIDMTSVQISPASAEGDNTLTFQISAIAYFIE